MAPKLLDRFTSCNHAAPKSSCIFCRYWCHRCGGYDRAILRWVDTAGPICLCRQPQDLMWKNFLSDAYRK